VASQDFRNVYLNLTSSGSLTVTRDLIVPTINKNYVIQNNTTGGQSIRVITAAGTGITVPNGSTVPLYVDGTNVIQAFDFLPTFNIGTLDLTNIEVTNIKAKDGTASATIADSTGVMTIASSVLTTTDINGGTIDGTTIGASTASTGAFTSLSASGAFAANGGATLGDASGDALTINSSAVSIPNGLNFDSNLLVLDAANSRIGINVASPSTLLDVQGTGAFARFNTGTASDGRIEFAYNSTNIAYLGINSSTEFSVWARSGNALLFGSNNTERMRITSTGNVGIGTSSPATQLSLAANNTGAENNTLRFWDTATNTTTNQQIGKIEFYSSDTSSPGAGVKSYIGAFATDGTPEAYLAFATADGAAQATERMRIDAGGDVGIATSNPTAGIAYSSNARILGIAGSGFNFATSYGSFNVQNNRATPAAADVLGSLDFASANNTQPLKAQIATVLEGAGGGTGGFGGAIVFNNRANNSASMSERMRIDSSGNLGLGVTPSAWSTGKAFELGAVGSGILGLSGETDITENAYFNAGWKYAASSLATAMYSISQGKHIWFNAPSGTAGNTITFTQAMTLDASGRLGIGTSSPVSVLDVAGTTPVITIKDTQNKSWVANDVVGDLDFYSNDTSGTGPRTVARIRSFADNTGTTAAGALSFWTSAPDSAATEKMRLTKEGNLGLGGTPSLWVNSKALEIGASYGAFSADTETTGGVSVSFNAYAIAAASWKYRADTFAMRYTQEGSSHAWYNAPSGTAGNAITFTQAMTLDADGSLLVGRTSDVFTDVSGTVLFSNGACYFTRSGDNIMYVNRLSDDGALITFYQANTQEGNISVSGSTVSYNGGHLSRWSQLLDNSKDELILKGTVLSNLDEMCVWEKDGVVADNEQLNKMKVSDVEGDTNVAGVFVNWTIDEQYGVDDMNVAMTGDMIIRIAEGVTVQRGDLLMSAGDGTAKPQGDDIVRSKTIAKVTSTNVTCTYADGSYCVPCVLMAC
jgi:hypothetical protein